MVFLGNTFFGDINSLLPPPASVKPITSIQIFDGTYNQIFLSTNTNLTVNNFDDEWTYDTKMNADFNGTLDAGNSAFSLRNTDHVVIRRREKNTIRWMTIYVKKIKAIEDFTIHFIDKFARSGIEYEYCVSSFVNGVENSYIIENVYSDFEGLYITDKDCIYGTIYDLDGCDTSRNTGNQILEMLNSKYVSVVSNSSANYDSGSVSGTFIKINSNGEYEHLASLNHRNNFKNRLVNKKPLILKLSDGRIWMIRVIGNPEDIMTGHQDIRKITFEWVEIGDIDDMKMLYKNGFSDVDSRWWY